MLGNLFADALGERERRFPARTRQQQAEFIATQPAHGAAFAGKPLHAPGDLADEFITGGMAAAVIDHLELVEVEVQQRGLATAAPALIDGGSQQRLEAAAVGEAGE